MQKTFFTKFEAANAANDNVNRRSTSTLVDTIGVFHAPFKKFGHCYDIIIMMMMI